MALPINLPSLVATKLLPYSGNPDSWNLILWILAACSILAFAVFIERLTHLKKAEVDTSQLMISLRRIIRDRNIIEAIAVCDNTGGPVASIIRSGLIRHDRSKGDIESAMETTGLIEIARLEKNARVLSIISHIAPLIGLLGTVLGFIQAFSEMRVSGMMDISTTNIGAAMEYALVTTAAGLVVAIPTFVAYNYIVGRIEGFVLEIQITSSTIVDILTSSRSNEVQD